MMAGPAPRPHRGHTSPPRSLPCPKRVEVRPWPQPARGSLASVPGAGQGFAEPGGHGGVGRCEGSTRSEGGRVPEGCSDSSELQLLVSSSSCDGTSMAVFAKQAILGKKSQCKVPGMWQLSPYPAGRSCKWAHWSVQSPSDSSTPWPRLPAPAARCSHKDQKVL